MTEVLTARQLSFLQRAAAAGHVSVATVDEKKTFDELVAKKLIFGNQLTDAGWMELRKTRSFGSRTNGCTLRGPH